MNKIALLLTALLGAGVVSAHITGLSPVSYFDGHDSGDGMRTIDDRVLAYRCFKQTLEETIEALGNGEISLSEAHSRVNAASRQFHPEYFTHLRASEKGLTDDERLARNLVGHVRFVSVHRLDWSRQLPILEAELQDLLAEFTRRA